MAGKRSGKRSKSSRPKKIKKRASASKRKPKSAARPKSKAKSRVKPKPKVRSKTKRSAPAAMEGGIKISRMPAGAIRGVAAKQAAKGRGKLMARGGSDRVPQGLLEFEDGPAAAELRRDPSMGPLPPMPKKRRSKASQLNMLDFPGESLTVGMQAPEFSLPSTLGRRVSLAEFRGKRVILYFYPKDDTPGCTMEACGFRDSFPRIESKDAIVLGISLDDELSHERFAQKYSLPFPLLSDKDAAVSRQYGTYKEKSLYGRSFWGIERTTFVIDREGKVEHVFRRVKVEGHAEEVMATLAL